MREIKFRGLTTNEEPRRMAYGCLTLYSEVESYIIEDLLSDKGTTMVDAKTVGQFTGLHDKNGKEIYEGDWIDVENKADAIIVWTYGIWHMKFLKTNEYFYLYPSHTPGIEDGGQHPYVEVIGNIYENPELLK